MPGNSLPRGLAPILLGALLGAAGWPALAQQTTGPDSPAAGPVAAGDFAAIAGPSVRLGHTHVDNGVYQSGSPSRRAGIVTDDGPAVFRSTTYGCESDATTLSVLANGLPRSRPSTANQDNGIQVMGGLCSGGFHDTYGGLDSVATFFENNLPPPIAVDRNATFDAHHVIFSTPLTPAQVAQVQPGMVVRTNPIPIAPGSPALSPFQGVVSGIDPAGRRLLIQQWAQPGDPTGASIGADPQGYAGSSGPYRAIVHLVLNVYGNNTIVKLGPGGGQDYADVQNNSQRAAIGYETIMFNDYPVTTARSAGLVDPWFDVPMVLAYHATANGTGSAAFSCDPGSRDNGGTNQTAWEYCFVSRGASFAGFDVVPVGSIAPRYGFLDESLAAATPWHFAYVPQEYGHPGKSLKFGVASDGTQYNVGWSFADGSLDPSVPLAQIFGYGGTAGARNSGEVHYLAARHDFYDPTGAYWLGVEPKADGVALTTLGQPITFDAPVRLPTYTVAALPPRCSPGEVAYASDGRKAGEAPGAGSGVAVLCTGARPAAAGAWFPLQLAATAVAR